MPPPQIVYTDPHGAPDHGPGFQDGDDAMEPNGYCSEQQVPGAPDGSPPPDPLVVSAFALGGLPVEQGTEVFLYFDIRGK